MFNKTEPIHWAVSAGGMRAVDYLLGAKADLEALHKNNWTPLFHAASSPMNMNLAMVIMLVSRGANLDQDNGEGTSPRLLLRERGGDWKKLATASMRSW